MNYTPEQLGWKLYGLYLASDLDLFHRPLVIFANTDTKEEIIKKLTGANFKDNDEVAIRFSKDNVLNLPFFLGSYSLVNIAQIIIDNKVDSIPFVHGLVKTKFCAVLYYDGNSFFIEVYPGMGARRKKVFAEYPDIIKIDKKMIIVSRYLKNRLVEYSDGSEIEAPPFDFAFLKSVADKILAQKSQYNKILEIINPLQCELNAESVDDINLVGIEKTVIMNTNTTTNSNDDYYIAKSLEDLKNYNSNKKLFLDIPLTRDFDTNEILKLLPKNSTIYLKSLTMHLAILFREHGFKVDKVIFKGDYETKTYPIQN
ncbi:MAG TPA: hypothetical protein DEB09_00120 [Candidatus Magasanikbacteria bacterium]|nr:hypothetical protein [Candidatus Magasanikbacteria bacterium]